MAKQENQTEEVRDPKETKDAAFKRIGSRRVTNALHAIGLLKGLANTAQYEYTEDQVARMLGALNGAIEEVKEVYAAKGKVAGGKAFDL